MTDVRSMVQFINREEEEQLAQAKAQKLGLNYINLVDYQFAPGVIQILPNDIVDQYFIIPYLRIGRILKIATPDPEKQGLKEFLSNFGQSNNYTIELTVCSLSSFRYARKVLDLTEEAFQEQEAQVKQAEEVEREFESKKLADKKTLAKRLQQASTTQLLDMIFAGAIALDASDIHIEPQEEKTILRMRIDGVLQDIAPLKPEQYKMLRSRIKYLAKMKLNIFDIAQDGRFDYQAPDETIDIRVSAVPTPYGETFVLRLLRSTGKRLQLEELGFSQEQIKIIRQAAARPNGIILNTGPTGSGKTTTLYAILQELHKPGVKIITIENPIEYKIQGITQTQIEPDKGYNFANALKSALRQDPDIIMVGEMRDPETVSTAVQAAVTGHLVLSTLHTNSAPAAIPRLIDLGAKTYLLGGTINLIIAQRLVRRLISPQATGDEKYKGRIAIAELLVPDENINALIQKKASVKEFEDAAKQAGMQTLFEDGMTKVQAGLTTEEEVRRVALDIA